MRREAAAVAAVIVAVVGVLAPLTLGGRLASSADLTAFYAPFASFLHDRLAAGDIPYWAPGAFSGQPFLADAQSGVTYPPMLLASWLLDPIDALRAVATFHYLIAALGTYALARQLGASRDRLGFRRDRVRRLGPPRRALGGARAARRRGLAGAGAGARRGDRERAAVAPRTRAIAGLAFVLAHAPRERLAAARGAHARDLRDLAGRARGRARARSARHLRSPSRSASRPSRCCPGSRCCAYATASGYVDPDGIGSLLFGDRRGLVGRFGVSRSEIATLYLGAATPALALIGWRRGGARRRAGAPARLADRALGRLGGGPRRLADGPAAARAHRGRARARARHRARAPVRERPRRVRAAGGEALAERRRRRPRSASSSASSRAAPTASRSSYLIPLAAELRRCLRAAPLRGLAPLALLLVLGGDLAWQATHQDQPLRWLRESQIAPEPRAAPRSCSRAQRSEGPFRIATAAPEPALVHQLGAHRSPSARALLLDQEALRLGLEDVAGYNPVHLKRYKRADARLQRRARGRPPLRARAALRDAAAALAGGALLRLAAGRVAAGPAGRLPRPPQRGHARRRGAAVRAHRAAGAGAAGRARRSRAIPTAS